MRGYGEFTSLKQAQLQKYARKNANHSVINKEERINDALKDMDKGTKIATNSGLNFALEVVVQPESIDWLKYIRKI